MIEIETDRLLLRTFTMADMDELCLIFSDSEVVKYLGKGLPAGKEETEHALRSIIRHRKRHGYGRWAVTFKRTQELIGYGGLRCFHGTPELVYLLSKSYWGQGLATELAMASLKHGFEKLRFKHIVAMANQANKASHRVLEKVGMTFEKTARICDMDIFCYSLSRTAYRSQQIKTKSSPGEYAERDSSNLSRRNPKRLVA
jgi:ribosomal-protein-alanine N-acetyltransferase